MFINSKFFTSLRRSHNPKKSIFNRPLMNFRGKEIGKERRKKLSNTLVPWPQKRKQPPQRERISRNVRNMKKNVIQKLRFLVNIEDFFKNQSLLLNWNIPKKKPQTIYFTRNRDIFYSLGVIRNIGLLKFFLGDKENAPKTQYKLFGYPFYHCKKLLNFSL